MQEIYRTIENINEKIVAAKELLKLGESQVRVEQIHAEMSAPDFWKDNRKATATTQELSRLENKISSWQNLSERVEAFLELAKDKDDLPEDWTKEARAIEADFKKMETALLLAGEYDARSAVVSISAGAGGTDAQDWAEMLLRMYLRFCEAHGWIAKIISISSGAEAGVKSVEFEVEGEFAYGYLKCEAGVHRLVRISPFDAEKMRHTSFALVQVLPLFEETDLPEIKDDELKIDVFRSGGHGGQSVNTTDSAVRITHLPSGIVVTCQNERSQAQNKQLAMRVLKSRLKRYFEAQKEEEKKALRGEYTEASWGNQIRSYVLQPYRMVKDHRTEVETSDVDSVLDGDIDAFIDARLRNVISE